MEFLTIEKSQVLLDAAFSRAMKAASVYPKQKTEFYTIKGKEIAKIDVSAEYLMDTLDRTVKSFPRIEELSPFYQELFSCIVDVNELRKALSSIGSVSGIIKTLRRDSIVRLKEMKYYKGSTKKPYDVSQQYFGRVSSMIKGLKGPIEVYNSSLTKLRELPTINVDEECYILAGLPNVGKSTLMGKITESKPKIAAYPFTTQGLNVGTFVRKHLPIQVIDTPGLLDRPLTQRNAIELKAITTFQYLKGTIIFVVDPSEDFDKQKNLFAEIKKLFSDKKIFVVINKTDIAQKNDIAKLEEEFKNYKVILEGNGLNNLKEEMLTKVKK